MNLLRCPLCHASFISLDNAKSNLLGGELHHSLVCVNRHNFDRAKEGYFNLLPVQFKQSLEPGDSKAQLRARRLFLQAGYYATLRATVQNLLPQSALALLDLGCGEGYFTQALAEQLPSAQVYGVDISKEGVRMAAKYASQQTHLVKTQSPLYLVASAFDVPLLDGSLDVITRIYAPSRATELNRLLKPEGVLIVVTPGNDHLLGLRTRIYEEVRPHPVPQAPEGFTLLSQSELTGGVSVCPGEMTEALLAMTPFAWKMPSSLSVSMIQEGIEDGYHFIVSCYGKC